MSPTELIDQKNLTRLAQQAGSGRHAHTYLLTGRESERKKALALAFAKALNCPNQILPPLSANKTADLRQNSDGSVLRRTSSGGRWKIKMGGESEIHPPHLSPPPRRGEENPPCSVCRRIEAGIHPDVKWYGLDEEANSIKISDIRDFRNWLALKPFEAKVKVFIFAGAERLTAEAQNALLKSLEEPPPGNVILLLAPQAENLFDTIRSRAVEIKVPPFRSEEIRKVLIQEGAAEQEAEFLSRWAQGELALARSAREEKWFQKKNEWLDRLTENPVSFLDEFAGASREEAARVFSFLCEWARDLLVYRAASHSLPEKKGTGRHLRPVPFFLMHEDRVELIERIVEGHAFDSILELFERLEEIRKSLGDYANQKLALTQAEILWTRFINK